MLKCMELLKFVKCVCFKEDEWKVCIELIE